MNGAGGEGTMQGREVESGWLRCEDGHAEIRCPSTGRCRRVNRLDGVLHPPSAILANDA